MNFEIINTSYFLRCIIIFMISFAYFLYAIILTYKKRKLSIFHLVVWSGLAVVVLSDQIINILIRSTNVYLPIEDVRQHPYLGPFTDIIFPLITWITVLCYLCWNMLDQFNPGTANTLKCIERKISICLVLIVFIIYIFLLLKRYNA